MSDTPPSGARLIKREPVVLAVVPTYRDTWTFPSGPVEEVRPRRSEPVWTVVLALLLGLGLVAWTAWTTAWDHRTLIAGVGFVLVLIAAGLAYGRAHPVTYAVGAVTAIVGLLIVGTTGGAVVVCLLVGSLTWPAWIGYRSRRRWWPRLEALLTEHERVEGRVVRVENVSSGGTTWVIVASPAVEGRVWWVLVARSAEAHLEVGDPMTVWFRPADPAAAVLCVAKETVGPAARAGRPPVPDDGA